jgi:HrpA-like RNA helicase
VFQILLCEEEKGDILAFLTGQEDIDECALMIKDKLKSFPSLSALVLPIYANMP